MRRTLQAMGIPCSVGNGVEVLVCLNALSVLERQDCRTWKEIEVVGDGMSSYGKQAGS